MPTHTVDTTKIENCINFTGVGNSRGPFSGVEINAQIKTDSRSKTNMMKNHLNLLKQAAIAAHFGTISVTEGCLEQDDNLKVD